MGRKKKIKKPKVKEVQQEELEQVDNQEETVTDQLLENPELMLTKTEDFFTKNKKIIYAVAGVICLAIVGFVGYRYYKKSQQEEALIEMYPAEFFFAADSTDIALNGNGNYIGVNQIAEDYSISDAAKVANLYAGVALMEKGKFQEALDKLSGFSSTDVIVQGKAYCLMGDAHMELKQYDKAIKYYNKAANYHPNQFFTPTYLMKMALAYELQKDLANAIKAYQKIIDLYPRSQAVINAKKFKAKAEAQSGATAKG